MRLATPALEERQPVTDGERRRRPRHTATGGVTLLTRGLGEGPTRQRISSIQLQDVSPTGAGALSENRLEPGSRVALFFPRMGPIVASTCTAKWSGASVTGHGTCSALSWSEIPQPEQPETRAESLRFSRSTPAA